MTTSLLLWSNVSTRMPCMEGEFKEQVRSSGETQSKPNDNNVVIGLLHNHWCSSPGQMHQRLCSSPMDVVLVVDFDRPKQLSKECLGQAKKEDRFS